MFEPHYSITPMILNNITEIAEIKAVVERSRVLPLNEAKLKRQALLRMVYTSTSIEGNKLAEFEVGKIFEGNKLIKAPPKDIKEVENYHHALKEIEKMAELKHDVTEEEVLHIHKMVVEETVGTEKIGHYRPEDVFVLDDFGDGRQMLRFKAPPAGKVPGMVQDLLEWLTKAKMEGIHPVVRAGIFHLEFVSIHPFTDGNGRTARLITQLILYRAGWDFRKIIVLEDYYNQNRLNYYNAEHFEEGKKYSPTRDFTHWLEYFTQGFVVEARRVLEQVQSIGYGKEAKESEQIFLDADEIKIMDFVTTVGKITSDDVVDVLKVAKRTAQLKLKGLVDKKLISSQGKGPSTFYTLP
ncbi:Fic family protein [Candidatus Daviesbacteria bacterium]|nr:Fic family protein [Candidatus Daviesbacteria bacterium]